MGTKSECLASAAQVRGPLLCRENPAQSSCQGVPEKLGLFETGRLKQTVFLQHVDARSTLDRLPTSTIGRFFRNKEVHASWQDMRCLTWHAKTWESSVRQPRHPHVCLELSAVECFARDACRSRDVGSSDSRAKLELRTAMSQDMAKGYPGNPRVFESEPQRSRRASRKQSLVRPDPRISMPAGDCMQKQSACVAELRLQVNAFASVCNKRPDS